MTAIRYTKTRRGIARRLRAAACALGVGLALAGSLWAHGGKTHTQAFTALQALQKATTLFDRLIVEGKLDETWETGLQRAEVSTREIGDQKEYRVGFHRESGSPGAVYIFFSAEGQYSGSNFAGGW
jgi:hypothetical protein